MNLIRVFFVAIGKRLCPQFPAALPSVANLCRYRNSSLPILVLIVVITTESFAFPKTLSGIYRGKNTTGNSHFLMEEENRFETLTIYCPEELLRNLPEKPESNISIRVKASKQPPNFTEFQCSSAPIIRVGSRKERSVLSKQRGERIIGQVLNADSKTGFVTIQTNSRKRYLKIDPALAESYEARIQKMEMVTVDAEFTYDRVRGLYVLTPED